jgi:tetratricopeptide (TPR) repeat protein
MGKHHPDTIATMNSFAMVLSENGNSKKALSLQRKVLKWRRKFLGEEHPQTLHAMLCLAATVHELGDLVEARMLEEGVLKVRQRTLGDDHPETIAALGNLAITMNNIAVALRKAGDLDEAEPLQMRAMSMVVSAFGADSLQAAATYSSAGALLKLRGSVEQSLEFFRTALAIRESQLGIEAELTLLIKTRMREILH